MSEINYIKYSATGNTFLAFDCREVELPYEQDNFWDGLSKQHQVDGFLFLFNSEKADFKMVYLNADGGGVEMCGNGGRAISFFAMRRLGLKPGNGDYFTIETPGAIYNSRVGDLVELEMTELSDVGSINIDDLFECEYSLYSKTGVPHCVFVVDSVDNLEIDKIAAPIRADARFKDGVNVNFIEIVKDNEVKIRTFERGVEGETGACGTGATAAAVLCSKLFGWRDEVLLHAAGGDLIVRYNEDLSTMFLIGSVDKLGEGSLKL